MAQPFWMYDTLADQTTTDAYADLEFGDAASQEKFTKIHAFTSGPLSFMLRNTHAANGITYQILGSNDPSLADADWAVVTTGTGLAALAKVEVTHALAYYLFYKVQIKATVGSSQGTVSGNACHKRV